MNSGRMVCRFAAALMLASSLHAAGPTSQQSEINLATIVHHPVGDPSPLRPIKVVDGTLVYPDGSEVALWGVNYQPTLSWEYDNSLKRAGVALDAASLKHVIDQDLPQLQLMHTGIIRVHLLPADFTDANGDIVETPYLDALDYLVSQCDQRGIYLYLTLVNGMGKWYCPASFMTHYKRDQWVVDDDCVKLTRNYIHALLTRENRYTHTQLAKEPSLGLIELLNEPEYPSHTEARTDPRFAALQQKFLQSLAATHATDDAPHYATFRESIVEQYLRDLVGDVRAAGAAQPIVWNLNWPGYVKDHEDVVDAVAKSPIDAVSFCCYPGQSDVTKPYWDHPTDLSTKNYIPFLQGCYDNYISLRYLLGKRLAGKAKVVYEFEEFFNRSEYLYPEMAKLLRAFGAQTATMWRYTPQAAVTQMQPADCSHNLNLESTPGKAVSFAIAADVFAATPRYQPYHENAAGDNVVGPFETSFTKNLGIESNQENLIYSSSFQSSPLMIHPEVKIIIGTGSSPLVSYDGSGSYFIAISDTKISIRIFPDVIVGSTPYLTPVSGNYVCKLDDSAVHHFRLHLPQWNDQKYTEWQISAQGRKQLTPAAGGITINGSAGDYLVEKQ